MNTPVECRWNAHLRSRVGLLILTSGMVFAVLPAPLDAQERWGEVGAAGISMKELARYSDSRLGFALNVGAWRKVVSFEAYIVSVGTYVPAPSFLGGSVMITPFHAARLVPYVAAGIAVDFIGMDIAPNAGIGVKLAPNNRWGLRADVRLLRYQEATYGEISFGVYLTFGRRTGLS